MEKPIEEEMERVRLTDMAQALDVHVTGAAGVEVVGVSTDSRTVRPGDLFFAIRGDNFDGHEYVEDAFAKGACAAVVSDDGARPGPVLAVRDTTGALLELAAWYRGRFDIPVVAVTGSNGKTTTKDMTAAVLSTRFRTAKTKGNYNNHIGVPLTLFEIESEHEMAVVEMGMNHPGEIARLAAATRPSVGVITNVAEAHMETMHDIDTIAQAKAELLDALPPDGTSILNWDDSRVKSLWTRGPDSIVTFGLSEDAEVRAVDVVAAADGVSFELADDGRVTLPVPGRHNVMNALAAIAVGRVMGIPDADAARGLSSFEASPMRMRFERVGAWVVLNDSYNCNPGSLGAALEVLVEVACERTSAAALGDMLELGSTSERAHREAGARAAELGVDRLYLFGTEVAALARGAIEAGMPAQRVRIFESKTALVDTLRKELDESAVLLVKGSRGMCMEEVVELLTEEAPASKSAEA
ncbi:MAG: UDP-N-acetylmuramoyl-tripeptide--D-alanyl-D-alanine ligase [Candidatus Eisenbacteria bacterium]